MISIVVPLYNEGQSPNHLITHLNEIADLHEAVLVDASDELVSKEVVRKLSMSCPENITIIESAKRGRAMQMNLGASRTTGNVLLFLHCDSRLPQNALSTVQKMIDSGRAWGRFDITLDGAGILLRIISLMINLRSRYRQIATGDQCIFVTASLFRKVGGYPEIALMEDIELSTILKQYSKPCLITLPVLTSARRWKNRGVIYTVLLMWRLRFLYWCGVSPEKLNRLYGDER
ncbi:MAG: TIGR04283 family arsenosugar biosynthesis glycosyltransferase [Gammaproteobacteria bacterium]|nr:TIGR04283 family arsenosugar biosynthesis glycosyltransferase [Gammaproteobacteria bacterium]MCY4218108.1 TIGR04283 family arsenosugar biosynthesis glycosyltransferase [Gammaproteobacteria bacterium]MCY4274826.1 TIGR04283 family arsenosugar biosynthesis glycosyltransferase [Gammaproteobacteria bacterium]